mgnify:CR=1 FL=1
MIHKVGHVCMHHIKARERKKEGAAEHPSIHRYIKTYIYDMGFFIRITALGSSRSNMELSSGHGFFMRITGLATPPGWFEFEALASVSQSPV